MKTNDLVSQLVDQLIDESEHAEQPCVRGGRPVTFNVYWVDTKNADVSYDPPGYDDGSDKEYRRLFDLFGLMSMFSWHLNHNLVELNAYRVRDGGATVYEAVVMAEDGVLTRAEQALLVELMSRGLGVSARQLRVKVLDADELFDTEQEAVWSVDMTPEWVVDTFRALGRFEPVGGAS